MKVLVTDEGVLLPPTLLKGATEVEIIQEAHRIIVVPVLPDDPIWGLGTEPVSIGITDGAAEHDRSLYGER